MWNTEIRPIIAVERSIQSRSRGRKHAIERVEPPDMHRRVGVEDLLVLELARFINSGDAVDAIVSASGEHALFRVVTRNLYVPGNSFCNLTYYWLSDLMGGRHC